MVHVPPHKKYSTFRRELSELSLVLLTGNHVGELKKKHIYRIYTLTVIEKHPSCCMFNNRLPEDFKKRTSVEIFKKNSIEMLITLKPYYINDYLDR